MRGRAWGGEPAAPRRARVGSSARCAGGSGLSERLRRLAALAILLLAGLPTAVAQLPLPLPQPSLDLRGAAGSRTAVATPDGGILVAHDGRWLGGDIERPRLAKLRPDGSVDTSWVVEPNSTVFAIAIVGDDVYLGGSFTTVNGVARRGLARVSLTTGSLSSWDPNAGSASSFRFDSFAIAGDALYVGGFFSQLGSTARTLVAKLDRNSGTLDPAFAVTVTPAGGTSDVAVRSDGTALFVGGTFSAINGVARSNAAKLSLVDGAVDPAWAPAFNAQVLRIELDGGFLYATGCFGQVAGVPRNFVARVATGGAGAPDPSWNPAPNGGCTYGLAIDASHVYVGGPFSQLGGGAVQRVGRVGKTGAGALDATWLPALDGVFTFGAVPRADGTVFVHGDFVNVGTTYSPGLVRVTSTGSPLPNLPYSEARGYVWALAEAPDGGTYVGGYFHRIGTVQRRGLLRLSPTGALDTAWQPPLAGRGNVLALARDANHLYVGGDIATAGTPSLSNLLRVTHAGSVDAGWAPGGNGPANAMAIDEASNTVVVGGSFTSIAGQLRNRLAEINRSTGQPTAFNPGANGTVLALALVGGDLFVGGQFTTVGSLARSRLAKISRSGVVDPSFVADANSQVNALLPGPNGTLYVGGFFNTIGSLGRTGLARLSQSTGAPDPLWNTFPNGTVYAITPSSDGIYLAGGFTTLGDQPRTRLARVSHGGVVAPLFAPAPDNTMLTVLEQGGTRVLAGGFVANGAPASSQQVGVLAYPRDASPVATTLTITSDLPENTQPHQFYRVEVSAGGAGVPVSGQRVVVECDSGVSCEVVLNAAGTGACELASRTPGTRTLTARFAGTPLFLPATDTEPHNVAGIAATPPANPSFELRAPGFVAAGARSGADGLVIGGSFNRVGNTPRRGLARLLADGSPDPAWSADVIGPVSTVAADAVGDLYVMGGFTSIDGASRRTIAKLDGAGNLVPGWVPARTDVGSFTLGLDAAGNPVVQAQTFSVTGTPNFYRTSLFKLAASNGAQVTDFSAEITTTSTAVFPSVSTITIGSWLYVYGQFDAINGVPRRNLARLGTTGQVDAGWNPSPNGVVRDLEPDGVGGVYIAGDFGEIAGQTTIARFARLDASGALVTAFAPAPDAGVQSILRDGNALYVTGLYSSIGGIARRSFAKLDPTTGIADPGFAQIDATIFPSVVARLGSALWVGNSTFQMSASDVLSMGAVRFDPATAQQLPTPTVTRQAFVYALARQPDGATLIGGYFARPGSAQRNLVRITPTGEFDTGFVPPVDAAAAVQALLVRANGDIYAGLTSASGSLRKIAPSGALDAGFASTGNGSVRALADGGDGLVAGGGFTQAGAPAVTRNRIAKLDWASGQPLGGWNPDSSGAVDALAVDGGGAIYVGGGFNTLSGTPRSRLAKLNPDGSLDAAWQPQASSTVRSLLVDGSSVYAGGFFTTLNGITRRGLVRLDGPAATLAAWAPATLAPPGAFASATVYALARAQDGGILAGGSFRVMGGAYRSNVAKLDPTTGVADALWNPSVDATVYALLAGYGNTPTRAPLGAILQNIAIGGEFEFQGASPMPGFVAVPSVGQPTTDGLFCDGFEVAACTPAP